MLDLISLYFLALNKQKCFKVSGSNTESKILKKAFVQNLSLSSSEITSLESNSNLLDVSIKPTHGCHDQQIPQSFETLLFIN